MTRPELYYLDNPDVTEATALRFDRADILAGFRDRFHLPERVIYLDGNSLGLLSKDAEACLHRVLDEWRLQGINGWLNGEIPWFYYGERLGELMAPLVGAGPGEVTASSSTTVNLHALVSSFYQPNPGSGRTVIVADELNFPSDLYALAGQIALRGLEPGRNLRLVASRDGQTVEEDDVVAAMTGEVALALLPSVLYRSGQLLDLQALTREAHSRGILIGFDCSHSVGAVPHRFDEWGVDFAFWCGYKYLNAGPGSIAGLYVNRKHHGALSPGLPGWWGFSKKRQFDMLPGFEPEPGAGAWQIGTVSMLSAAPLEGSLRMFAEAGIDNVRAKSLALTEYLIYLAGELLDAEGTAGASAKVGSAAGPTSPSAGATGLETSGFAIATPLEPHRRGGHVALSHPEAVRITAAMKAAGVVPDFRSPNVIRLAPIALYTSFHDVWKAVHLIREIVCSGDHLQYPGERGPVA